MKQPRFGIMRLIQPKPSQNIVLRSCYLINQPRLDTSRLLQQESTKVGTMRLTKYE